MTLYFSVLHDKFFDHFHVSEPCAMLREPQHLTTLQNDIRPRLSICVREDVFATLWYLDKKAPTLVSGEERLSILALTGGESRGLWD